MIEDRDQFSGYSLLIETWRAAFLGQHCNFAEIQHLQNGTKYTSFPNMLNMLFQDYLYLHHIVAGVL